MELIDGQSLAQRLAAGPLPWRSATRIAAQVAAALAAAHAHGIVHRDVTPANVMLSRTGVKVVDFGIAAAAGERDREVLGTPAYLAPEQRAGGPAQPATDVYALGLLLYHCVTGHVTGHITGQVPQRGIAHGHGAVVVHARRRRRAARADLELRPLFGLRYYALSIANRF